MHALLLTLAVAAAPPQPLVVVVPDGDAARALATAVQVGLKSKGIDARVAQQGSPAAACLDRSGAERSSCLGEAAATALADGLLVVSTADVGAKKAVSMQLLAVKTGQLVKEEAAVGAGSDAADLIVPALKNIVPAVKTQAAKNKRKRSGASAADLEAADAVTRAKAAPAPAAAPAPPPERVATPEPQPAPSPGPAAEAPPPSLAPRGGGVISVVVLDAQAAEGVDKAQAALVSEEVAATLPQSAFKVTTASQLAAVLGIERQRQLSGCSEEAGSCLAEMANALGADVVIQTTVANLGDAMRASVVFISGSNGSALERVTVEGSGSKLYAAVREGVGGAAAALFAKLRPGNLLEPGKPGVRRYAWIPAVLGVALVGFGGALFAVNENNWRTLNSRDGRVSDPFALADSGRTMQTVAWVLSGIGGAALLTAAGLFALGAPTEPRVVLAPIAGVGGGGVQLAGTF